MHLCIYEEHLYSHNANICPTTISLFAVEMIKLPKSSCYRNGPLTLWRINTEARREKRRRSRGKKRNWVKWYMLHLLLKRVDRKFTVLDPPRPFPHVLLLKAKFNTNLYLKISFVPRSKHNPSQLQKNALCLISCRQIISLCCGNHTKHTNTRCGRKKCRQVSVKYGGVYTSHYRP
jgi:hypothetical protein